MRQRISQSELTENPGVAENITNVAVLTFFGISRSSGVVLGVMNKE